MTKQEIQEALKEARADVAALEGDLATIEEHAQAAAREDQEARQGVDLDERARTRGRLRAAQDLLQEHRAEVQKARSEVAQLEGALKREEAILAAVDTVREAEAARKHLVSTLCELDEGLRAGLKATVEAVFEYQEAQSVFFQHAQPFARGIASAELRGNVKDGELRDEAEAFMQLLKERGVDPTAPFGYVPHVMPRPLAFGREFEGLPGTWADPFYKALDDPEAAVQPGVQPTRART